MKKKVFYRRIFFYLLFAILIFATFAGFNYYRSLKSKAASLKKNTQLAVFTSTLQRLITRYNKAKVNQKRILLSQIQVLASRRKTLLLAQLKDDPELFLTYATLVNDAVTLPTDLQSLFEKSTKTTGYVAVAFNDEPKTGVAGTSYIFANFFLYPLPNQSVNVNQPIMIEGISLDNYLVPQNIRPLASTPSSPRSVVAPRNPPNGSQRTLAILFNFSNDRSEPSVLSPANVQSRLYQESLSVNNYLKEVSYNQLSIFGEVTSWLHPNLASTNCITDYPNWPAVVDQEARSAGYNPDPSIYQRIIYIFPHQDTCVGWVGMSINTTDPEQIPNKIFLNGNIDGAIIAHEIIHSLEIVGEPFRWTNHAVSLRCANGGKAIDIYENCSIVNGENYYDLMNSIQVDSVPKHVTSPIKYSLGWLNGDKLQNITASGTYVLNNLEDDINGPQALRLAKFDPATGATEYYFLEYRKNYKFDQGSFFEQNQGVVLSLWTTDANSNPILLKRRSILIDTTVDPVDNSFFNASMKINNTFTDMTNPTQSISITRLADDAQGRAQLQITIGSVISPTLSPTITSAPSVTPTSSPTATLSPTPTPGGPVDCSTVGKSWQIFSIVPFYNGLNTGLTINGYFPKIAECGRNLWSLVYVYKGSYGNEEKSYYRNDPSQVESFSTSQIKLKPVFTYSNGTYTAWVIYCLSYQTEGVCTSPYSFIYANFTVNNPAIPSSIPTVTESPTPIGQINCISYVSNWRITSVSPQFDYSTGKIGLVINGYFPQMSACGYGRGLYDLPLVLVTQLASPNSYNYYYRNNPSQVESYSDSQVRLSPIFAYSPGNYELNLFYCLEAAVGGVCPGSWQSIAFSFTIIYPTNFPPSPTRGVTFAPPRTPTPF